jgi:hypothetical protein
VPAAEGQHEPPQFLRVAAVQIADFVDGVARNGTEEMAARAVKAVTYIAAAAGVGAKIALFPEMALAQVCASIPPPSGDAFTFIIIFITTTTSSASFKGTATAA